MSFETRRQARQEARAAIATAQATQGAVIAFILLGLFGAWSYGWPALMVCGALALAVHAFRPYCPPDIDRRLDE